MVKIVHAFGLICSLLLAIRTNAQFVEQEASRYWIFFADKPIEQAVKLDARAAERRVLNDFPVEHSGDLPVNPDYLSAIELMVSELGWPSRWFNAVGVNATLDQIRLVSELPFVTHIRPMSTIRRLASSEETSILHVNEAMIKQANYPLRRMGKDLLDELGLDGSGVRVAVLDGGFPTITTNEAFDHIRSENRIVATYDFVKKREDVDGANTHGVSVLSNIAGIMDGRQPLGLATGAEFVLGRTEKAGEPTYEEDLWVAGVEWAERHGAQILNSSLGYTYHRYFQRDMDGSSMIARAASAAASRGLLVINAAGNEGSNFWEVIITPADGDSVLAVGGLSPSNDLHIDFGSYGPSADGRLKPNVSNFAQTVVANRHGYGEAFGTSFASPLTTGFAACVLQHYPHLSAMELFKLIEQSGHLYPYYDYAHGYGLPTASRIIGDSVRQASLVRFEKNAEGLRIELDYDPALVRGVNQYLGWNHVYVHIADNQGKLEHYWVYDVVEGDDIFMKKDWFKSLEGGKVRVHFRGSVNEYEL